MEKYRNKYSKTSWDFDKLIGWYTFVSRFIIFEFLAVTAIILGSILKNRSIDVFFNQLSLWNIVNTIFLKTGNNSTGVGISLENLSILIIFLTILIIYLYFFTVINEDPEKVKRDESKREFFFCFL
jgi:hypothetical protein